MHTKMLCSYKNQAEGCVEEGYMFEECLIFCSRYFTWMVKEINTGIMKFIMLRNI